MTVDLKRYQYLKESVDDLQRESDRAEGALTQLMKELKAEFDCNSLDEAESLLKKTVKEVKQAEQTFEDAVDEFEEEWKHVLQGEE
jgi:predicted  nucleic acid-binding Zn-ribbon protein